MNELCRQAGCLLIPNQPPNNLILFGHRFIEQNRPSFDINFNLRSIILQYELEKISKRFFYNNLDSTSIPSLASWDYFENINTIRIDRKTAAPWYSFSMICEIKVSRCIRITSIKSPLSGETFSNSLCGWKYIFNTFLSSS